MRARNLAIFRSAQLLSRNMAMRTSAHNIRARPVMGPAMQGRTGSVSRVSQMSAHNVCALLTPTDSQAGPFQPGEHQYQTPMPGSYSSTEPEQFRRSTPVSYPQYPTTNLPGNTSQYASYGGQYSSESYHSNYAQHGQVTEPVSQPQQQQHGYHASQGTAQSYVHGNHVGSSQSQTLPSSY